MVQQPFGDEPEMAENNKTMSRILHFCSGVFGVFVTDKREAYCARTKALSRHCQTNVFTWQRNSDNNRIIKVAQSEFFSSNQTIKSLISLSRTKAIIQKFSVLRERSQKFNFFLHYETKFFF